MTNGELDGIRPLLGVVLARLESTVNVGAEGGGALGSGIEELESEARELRSESVRELSEPRAMPKLS